MSGEPYVVRVPEGAAVPLVVSMPHTGTRVPEAIAAAFASRAIARLPMTDWHLHELYDFLPGLGVTSLHAVYSRFVVDLNRPPAPRPLYPGRFETGLVPEKTFDGEPVFARPPTPEEIDERRRRYHAPYHERLGTLLEAARRRFGRAWLIDAHSVTSAPSLLHARLEDDVYLGNRDGATCDEAFIGRAEALFGEHGLRVARNAPYKGGYITDHYGRLDGVQALQIEMCQRLYMDEAAPESALADPRFAAAKRMLREVFAGLAAAIPPASGT